MDSTKQLASAGKGIRAAMTITSITCISDLHGYKPALPAGDLLLIGGDLINRSTEDEYAAFSEWLATLNYEKIVITPGNHDTLLQQAPRNWPVIENIELLIDQHTTYRSLKIYASPWTIKFPGQNPLACAFTTLTDTTIKEYFDNIPLDTDILLTHSPPLAINSSTLYHSEGGSLTLRNVTDHLPQLKLHVFGHIHEAKGLTMRHNVASPHLAINAAYVDRAYIPVGYTRITLHH